MRRRPYDRFFDSGLQGYIVRTARKHYWRVASYYDLDDLISDGYLAFAICRSRYADRVENQSHFMALFKRVYQSIIEDLAEARTKAIPQFAISQIVDKAFIGREQETLEILAGGIDGEAELTLTLQSAPDEIKALLADIDRGVMLGRRHRKRPPGKGHKETTGEMLNRLLGTQGYDYEGTLRELLA